MTIGLDLADSAKNSTPSLDLPPWDDQIPHFGRDVSLYVAYDFRAMALRVVATHSPSGLSNCRLDNRGQTAAQTIRRTLEELANAVGRKAVFAENPR